MKHVTLALDEATLREARRIAAERSTTVTALVREFLERLTARESNARKARQRIAEPCRDSKAEVGERGWSRDDLLPRLHGDPRLGVYWRGQNTHSKTHGRQLLLDFLLTRLAGRPPTTAWT